MEDPETYKKPTVKIPKSANFLLLFICKFHIIGSGMKRMAQSPRKLNRPFVKDIVLNAFGTQWPFWSLFQKYETGVHSKVDAPKAAIVHSNV